MTDIIAYRFFRLDYQTHNWCMNITVLPGYKRVVGTGEEVSYIRVSLISGLHST